LDKANKHAKILGPDVRGSGHDSDDMELLGMMEEEIEQMLKEYVYFPFPSSGQYHDYHLSSATSTAIWQSNSSTT
jgi:hypothetical protein